LLFATFPSHGGATQGPLLEHTVPEEGAKPLQQPWTYPLGGGEGEEKGVGFFPNTVGTEEFHTPR